MKKLISSIACCAILAACAEQPSQIDALYVSPNVYRDKSCSNLMIERNTIINNVNRLTEQQQKAADTDAAAMGIGMVLFWPALFALGTTDDKSEALATAKGNYDAITAQMHSRRCKVPAETIQS
ncbi:MAG: hypothetical protein ACU0FH_14920 [Heliomarina sp.]|uniref:hypothetical protein n=1 Tax=Heliomarina sp. TaxID=2917556 RepID=UPI004058D842